MRKIKTWVALALAVLMMMSSTLVYADEMDAQETVQTSETEVQSTDDDMDIQIIEIDPSETEVESETELIIETEAIAESETEAIVETETAAETEIEEKEETETETETEAVELQGLVTMSKNSATIEVGETLKLSVKEDGNTVTANGWGSDKSSVATVSTSGTVTGVAPGSAVITAFYNGVTVECLVSVVKKSEEKTVRYNVLIMDASNSVEGTPLLREKEAAKKFTKRVLESDGENYMAVISMNSSIKKVCSFSTSYTKISTAIDGITTLADTNITDAIAMADAMLDGVPSGANILKNIIVCSDGLPNAGPAKTSGRYTSADDNNYKYANTAFNAAEAAKADGYFIYALGFFHNSTAAKRTFGKRFMKDIASEDKYFVIDDPNDISDALDDIADQILNVTINTTIRKLYVGETYQLKVYNNGQLVTPSKWVSTDPSIVLVNSKGLMKGLKVGQTTVKASYKGKVVRCTVTVVPGPSISLSPTTMTLYKGCKKQIKATVKGKSQTVTWKSSDKTVATVSSLGYVVGVKAGTATITATANGKSAKCVVTVKNPTISVKPTSVTVMVTKTEQLTATVKGKSQTVTWSSSNSSIAIVNSKGLVKGVKPGTATITAKANGVSAKCTVKVVELHPEHSQYFMIGNTISKYGSQTVNEYGVRLVTNKDAIIEKCAVYLKKTGTSTYERTIACKGQNITYATYVPYLAYKGKVVYDGSITYGIRTYSLSKDSKGVWSISANYGLIEANLRDSSGKNLTAKSTGVAGKNIKVFYDLQQMKDWLNK